MGQFIPRLPARLVDRLLPSEDIAINSIEHTIAWLNDLARRVPSKYGWRFRTSEAFLAELQEITSSTENPFLDINRLYWTDTLKTCEAYSLMCTWRIVELARSCVRSLSSGDLVSAALAARAGLESTCQYVDTARTISATLEKIPRVDLNKDIVASKDLETFLVRTVFASRRTGDEEIYKPTNIITIVDKVSKVMGQEHVKSTYEELCELAHPNFLGRSVYVIDWAPGSRPGDETRTIGVGEGPTGLGITQTIVRALSWSCGTHVTAFRLMSQSIESFLHRPGMQNEKRLNRATSPTRRVGSEIR
jgi:hypothetical protein